MQTRSKNFLLVSIMLMTVLGGCKKNQKKSSSENKSFFSKIHNKKNQKKSIEESAEPFDLEKNAMKTFALDDQTSKHTTSSTKPSESPMFSWEDSAAEETKHLFKTLYFEFDKDILGSDQQSALKDDIAEIKKMIKQGKIIVIEGHACHSAGSAIYNLAISERRARYVAQKCAEAGIDSIHIKIAPRGQEMPVVKGGNRKQQARNRRVEIYAIDAK